MSGTNHIAGGIMFTGIYLSMFDVNIYSSFYYLAATVFFSLLPDIDHTKSIIGKSFYPIAKWLDRKYGHRTLTHSLLCYFTIYIVIATIEKSAFQTTVYSSIFVWSYGSHLILDMITLQGVPLFFPFKRNPCVIPGNPNFRLRSMDFKTEAISFCLFTVMIFSCKDLFANGFWSTYDKAIASLKTVHNETLLTDKAIFLQYKKNGKADSGYVVASTLTSVTLINKNSFFTLTNADNPKEIKPLRTTKKIIFKEQTFNNISFDSLMVLVEKKAIQKISLISTLPINYTKENIPTTSTNVELTNIINPIFHSADIDSIDRNTEKEIKLLRLEIDQQRQLIAYDKANENERLQAKETAAFELQELEKKLRSEDLATREKATKDYPAALKSFTDIETKAAKKTNPIRELEIKLSYLTQRLRIVKKQSVTGYIKYLLIE